MCVRIVILYCVCMREVRDDIQSSMYMRACGKIVRLSCVLLLACIYVCVHKSIYVTFSYLRMCKYLRLYKSLPVISLGIYASMHISVYTIMYPCIHVCVYYTRLFIHHLQICAYVCALLTLHSCNGSR